MKHLALPCWLHRPSVASPRWILVDHAAPAVVIDTLAVSLAFGLLLFSRVLANALLGATVGLAFIICICLFVVVVVVVALTLPRRDETLSRYRALAFAAGVRG